MRDITRWESARRRFFNRLDPRFPLFEGTMQRHAESPEAMEALGREAAELAGPGSVIALVGGLGAGKTHWTKGFVAGIGSAADVTSPPFGLLHEYPGGRLPVFHLDFYRLESAAELISLGWDELLDQGGVIIAEWGDKFPELLPPETVWLHFTVEAEGRRSVRERVA
jgi:tRNA threonylcarbamoyladenosine biosynthesis protein TsaE